MEDVRRLQAINGDCIRSGLDLEAVGLVVPVQDPAWADIRGLEGSPDGTLP